MTVKATGGLIAGIDNTKGPEFKPHMNDKTSPGRLHFFRMFVQTILLRPITTTVKLAFRTVKLLTWVPVKAGIYKISGYHTESSAYFERQYLNTVKTVRKLIFIPSVAIRAFRDMTVTREKFVDDIERKPVKDYFNVDTTKSFQQFSSYLHGCETFEVIHPKEITEFAAPSDGSLKTIMASHVFKPDTMAISFGTPNVSTFVTEREADNSVQTIKVDAKSLWREGMTYHATNGKVQSGVFLVPTNLPAEALNRFKGAAVKMQGRKDITCVNTNSRVLQEAGFSIEGVKMEDIVFPNTMLQHFLFRNVLYTDSGGTKHKVHFDIVNTTNQNLEDYFRDVDTAVIGTRLRHIRRHSDTEENQKVRGLAAKALIDQEKVRLLAAGPTEHLDDKYLGQRKISVSVPSFLGNAVAKIWGRHTIYEMDLSKNKKEINEAFAALAEQSLKKEEVKLRPFPTEKPSFATRLKRDLFFSGPIVRLLRRHMMGRVDEIHLHTQDIFKHLESTKGARLNYVLLDDKIVLAKVHANSDDTKIHRKAADWALSKHALLSGRQEVYCSGEIWFDMKKKCFMLNHDSGTYSPSIERVKKVAELANKIFDTQKFGNKFEAVTEEVSVVA